MANRNDAIARMREKTIMRISRMHVPLNVDTFYVVFSLSNRYLLKNKILKNYYTYDADKPE